LQPNGITLRREYRIREEAPDKATNWGEQLWTLLASEVRLEVPTFIVDREAYDFVRTRLVNHLLSRLVVRAKQARAANAALPDETRAEAIRRAVDDVIALPEERQALISYLLTRIVDRIERRGATLTAVQKARVTGFARARRHRCYICGRRLFYGDDAVHDPDEEKEAFRSFELDHLFPQARGGGRGSDNLAACCESCNKYKDVNLSFADFPIEMSQSPSLNPVQVAKVFDGRIKFALLWRQGGACARCGKKFHDTADERLYLVRRDVDDAYHFTNVQVACGECEDGDMLDEGIKIRD
jgi:hypothetical protein